MSHHHPPQFPAHRSCDSQFGAARATSEPPSEASADEASADEASAGDGEPPSSSLAWESPESDSPLVSVELNNQQDHLFVPAAVVASTVERVLIGEGCTPAEISVAIVDDATIRRLNCQFLNHDWETDVLSFLLTDPATTGRWEGEIIASAQTALRLAVQQAVCPTGSSQPSVGVGDQRCSESRQAWGGLQELLLYIIHGALHLSGHDDQTVAELHKMQAREQLYLQQLGLGRAPGRDPGDQRGD